MRVDAVVLLTVLFASPGYAQTSAARPADYTSADDLVAALKRAGGATIVDTNVKQVTAGPNVVSVNIARRTELGPAVLHDELSEIYYVTEGVADLVTGGDLVNPGELGRNATRTGTSIRTGETRRIGVGDVIVIPAGTPHAFSWIEGTITYLNIRVNPK